MNRLRAMFTAPVVLTDGAWGTQLQARGLRPGEPADEWNLSRPDDVRAVARSYVEAGSRVILTNTFQANPWALARVGLADRMHAINAAGVHLSRQAAGTKARVFATIGPAGAVHPPGGVPADAIEAAFRAQAEALALAEPDALVLETFSDVDEARLALRAALATGLPVLASFTFTTGHGGLWTYTGASPEQVGAAMAEAGADGVGANCGEGPETFGELARRLGGASGLPVWLKPNAGLPTFVDGQARYAMDSDAFAALGPAMVAAGAMFVGGCCGTDPAAIRVLGQVVARAL